MGSQADGGPPVFAADSNVSTRNKRFTQPRFESSLHP